jgi:hypothetical protein
MKALIAGTIAAGLLTAAALPVQAQTPDLNMQDNGSAKGTAGASAYAPGQKLKAKGSVKGTTGASGYASGDTNTGAGVKTDADVKAGGTGIKAGAGSNTDVKIK